MHTFRSFLGSRTGFAVSLAAAALGAYLLVTHTGHVLGALPYLFLLACPLMHVFGHHHHGSVQRSDVDRPSQRS